MIRPLIDSDLKTVVKIHLHSFPGFFLSFLGPRFLELFYRSFLEDSTGIGFVALDGDGSVIGSVVGPMVPGGYFKRLMRRRWWAFCLASASALLRRPWIESRLLRARRYHGDTPEGDSVPQALLSSIGGHPRGPGAGSRPEALVEAWLFEVRRRYIDTGLTMHILLI